MAVRKTGLGKGLDSLIPVAKKEKMIERKTGNPGEEKAVERTLKITEIEPNRDQPRKNFNEDALLELAESIKNVGIIQPIIVQKREEYYEIIAGERRWRAAKMAGLKEIPVIIKNFSDLEIVEIALIENIQRENLNPIEEAYAYKRLIDEFKLKQDEIAEKVSKSRAAITNAIRLLKLDQRVQQMVVDDMISTGHARALIGVEDAEEQVNLAHRIFDEKMSVREVERLVQKIQSGKKEQENKKSEAKEERDFIYSSLENTMKEILGTKVTVKHQKNHKGKIEIEYYSDEDLDRLVSMLESIQECK
ncbi:MAG: ParB/RepB/Spo0J family partition protein [Lachnospiraceae bacterium]|nr:ParB/RepB/Spo0J family partition protein [Robinsoniella sp.]MDY3767525.1 ParB/RepB/Spo0J family partition protein [Lachnospiraceae bacterium]